MCCKLFIVVYREILPSHSAEPIVAGVKADRLLSIRLKDFRHEYFDDRVILAASRSRCASNKIILSNNFSVASPDRFRFRILIAAILSFLFIFIKLTQSVCLSRSESL